MTRTRHSQPAVKPEVALLEDLFSSIEEGRLRCPRFQRPFVWTPQQMRELFDSVERGYPVGTLLLWEPEQRQTSLDRIGALRIPTAPETGNVAYILDGHQRLSTLYSALRLPEDFPRTERQEDWRWWLYRDLRTNDPRKNGFVHVQRGTPNQALLPLRSVMRTMDFLNFARTLSAHNERANIEEWVSIAESLANHFKSYRLATIRILGGTVEQAVEIFSRLNSKGRRMTPDQMFSALIYPSASGESGTTLADAIDDILAQLSELNFGLIERNVAFRTILAAAGQDELQPTDWERLARNIEDVQPSIDAAKAGLLKAIRFLRREAGVCHWRLLPYAYQLVLLAAFFVYRPRPTAAQKEELKKWFWATSWSGWFAGANTTEIREALARFKQFAARKADLLPMFPNRARPYPLQFDMRGARVRTLLLWQLRTPPLDASGRKLSPGEELASHDARAYRHVITTRRAGDEWPSNPANRILMPPEDGKSVRQTLVDLAPDVRDEVLESHHIPQLAYEALCNGNAAQFVQLRANYMAQQEQQFMCDLEMEPAEDTMGPSDFDSDAETDLD